MERTCLMCGGEIPAHILDIDPEAQCCSGECMTDYKRQLLANFVNHHSDELSVERLDKR